MRSRCGSRRPQDDTINVVKSRPLDSHGPVPPGHEHGHVPHGVSVSTKLIVATVATLLFVALELVVGVWANALALIGDAFHNVTDSIALCISSKCNTSRPRFAGSGSRCTSASVTHANVPSAPTIIFDKFIAVSG